MLYFLPAPLRGIITGILLVLNTLFCALLVFPSAFIICLLPKKSWRQQGWKILHEVPRLWTNITSIIMKLMMRLQIEVRGSLSELKPNDWYLMLSNHQTWADIIILYHVFNRRIPSLRFFMKKELLWQLPIAAQACQLLDYPFMQRYSKEFLAKNPHLKGKDIESTRRACKKFAHIPITMINFVEGGRFTAAKKKSQNSPYQYLLKPKSGGVAFVLSTMGSFLHKILNVTVIYPEKHKSFWDFVCGRMHKIIVYVECLPITAELLGDYENNPEYRAQFQQWLNGVWQKKDRLLDELQKDCSKFETHPHP